MSRILIVPSVSYTSAESDVFFREMSSLMRHVEKTSDDAFWYIVIPTWMKEGLHWSERVHYVQLETTRDAELNRVIGYPLIDIARHFSRMGGEYVIDAVITDCVQFASQLKAVLSDPSDNPVPVFVRDFSNAHKSARVADELLLATNISTNHFLPLSAQHHIDVKRLLLGRLLSPASINEYEKQYYICRESVPFESGYGNSSLQEDDIVLFCDGDQEQDDVRKILSVYETMMHVGCDVVIGTRKQRYALKKVTKSEDLFQGKLLSGLVEHSQGNLVKRTHAFLSVTKDSRQRLREVARLVLGPVGVFPYDTDTVNLLGADYPFYYKRGDIESGKAVLSWVCENYHDAEEEIERLSVRSNVRSRVDASVVLGNLWRDKIQVVASAGSDKKKRSKSTVIETVQKVASAVGNEFAMLVFLDILEEHLSWLKPWGNKGTLKTVGRVKSYMPTMYDLRAVLTELGYVDHCKGRDIMFVKEAE